jgi:hypothetical protein
MVLVKTPFGDSSSPPTPTRRPGSSSSASGAAATSRSFADRSARRAKTTPNPAARIRSAASPHDGRVPVEYPSGRR